MTNAAALFEKIRRVAEVLLDDSRPPYSLRSEVLDLSAVFEAAGGFARDTQQDIAAGETKTSGGIAISPAMASMCVDDFARTVQFIRSVHAAIEDLQQNVTIRPVEILYAGCGPWAPLAVPVMSMFGPDEVRFTLLDIHEESIESVERIVQELDLQDRVREFEVADAVEYSIDSATPDLIIVEMLRASLESEPQVAVVRHLRRQAPSAVIIPERVLIELALVNASREHSIDEIEPERDRIIVGTVYALDDSSVEAPIVVRIPEFDESRYCPMLLTSIDVYHGIVLRDYDSGVTLPKKLSTEIKQGDTVEFVYEIGSNPRLTSRVISRTAE